MKHVKTTISAEEIEKVRTKIRNHSNAARYEEAHRLAKKMMAAHPGVLWFEYYEAVFGAEGDEGFTPAQIKARHKTAAGKLKKLTRKLRGADPLLQAGIRNEYLVLTSAI